MTETKEWKVQIQMQVNMDYSYLLFIDLFQCRYILVFK